MVQSSHQQGEEMKARELEFVQNQIGYTFQNEKLLKQAFIKESPEKTNANFNNDTLEFYGDKILGFILAKKFFSENSKISIKGNFMTAMNAGMLTGEYCKYASNKYLAERIEKLRLRHFLIGRSGKKLERVSVKSEGDLFEAILGAVAVDCNWNIQILDGLVERMLIDDLSKNASREEILQYCAEYNLGQVDFYEEELGFNHRFTVRFSSLYKEFSASDKKSDVAEVAACRKALNYLQMVLSVGKLFYDNAKTALEDLSKLHFFPQPEFHTFLKTDGEVECWGAICSIKGFDQVCDGEAPDFETAENIVAGRMMNFVFDLAPKTPKARELPKIIQTYETEENVEDNFDDEKCRYEMDIVSQVYNKFNCKEISQLEFSFDDSEESVTCIALADGQEYRSTSDSRKKSKKAVCEQIMADLNKAYEEYLV